MGDDAARQFVYIARSLACRAITHLQNINKSTSGDGMARQASRNVNKLPCRVITNFQNECNQKLMVQ